MNDVTNVNAWQDGVVTEQENPLSTRQVAECTAITTIDQLKAIADPTRLAILEALMSVGPGPLPVMSVKELAATLGEPQTKLYRHVRVLESAGLIGVAATRMVSGIAEQRYQACQRDLDFAAGLLRQEADAAEGLVRAVFDRFRNGYTAAVRAHPPTAQSLRAGQRDDAGDGGPPETSMLTYAIGRRTPAQVAAIRASLSEALAAHHFDSEGSDDPDAVQIHVLVGYFVADDGQPG